MVAARARDAEESQVPAPKSWMMIDLHLAGPNNWVGWRGSRGYALSDRIGNDSLYSAG